VFRAGVPKALFEAPIFAGGDILSGHDWDVASDGNRFLIAADPAERAAAPITVVLNWMEALRK